MIMFSWLKKIFQKNNNNNEETNVVMSIAKAKILYKELIIKTHPDKHPLREEQAKELTELINNNRYNYEALLKIKKQIEEDLYNI